MTIRNSEIDRLGERLRDGNITEDDLRLLDSFRRSYSASYEAVGDVLDLNPSFAFTGRAKSTSSIVEKLKRETIRLSQFQDIEGCRIVVGGVIAQDESVAWIRSNFPGAKVFDRRRKPSHGYRAVHVLVVFDEKTVEIQVRTALQHQWAEMSEKLSDTLDKSIKYGGGRPNVRQLLDACSLVVQKNEDIEQRFLIDLPSATQGMSEQNRQSLDQLTLKVLELKGSLNAMLARLPDRIIAIQEEEE